MPQNECCATTWTSWSRSWWVGVPRAEASSSDAWALCSLFLDTMTCFWRNSGLAGTWCYNLAQSYSECSFKFQSISQGVSWRRMFWVWLSPDSWSLVPVSTREDPAFMFLNTMFLRKSPFKERYTHARTQTHAHTHMHTPFKKKSWNVNRRWLLTSIFKTSRRKRLWLDSETLGLGKTT